jgi:hypothetical protein
MNTFAKIFGIFALLLTYTATYSQTYTDTKKTIKSFESTSAENNFLSSQSAQIRQSGGTANSVFISQVGDNNEIISTTTSNSSDINYIQQGDNNGIFVKLAANRIEQDIIQNGSNNHVLNFNSARLDFHKGEVIQNGSGQNLTWYGGNSISEKLKVTMEGTGQSVIVRNFN